MSKPDWASRDTIDQIEISSPCTVSWDEMRAAGGADGDRRVRFCGQCRQNVYNVEAMSRGEARRLIAAREGRVCVRILRRPDGTVVTGDCWARLRAARRRGLLPFLGMLVLVGFTEIIAIGVGLARLKGMVGGEPAPRPRVTLPLLGESPLPPVPTVGAPLPNPRRMIGALPPHRFPQPTKKHYVMGKRGPTPPADKLEMMGLLE